MRLSTENLLMKIFILCFNYYTHTSKVGDEYEKENSAL